MQPTFITGANAKINIAGVTVGFCNDVQYQINVKHISTQILGAYESSSIEPVSYSVMGGFSVIRYARGIDSNVPNLSSSGNGIGSIGNGSNNNKIHDSFDPSQLKYASFFELVIYQKRPNTTIPVARIRDCRIISSTTYLTKKNVMVQTFQFMGRYVDEDSFLAFSSSAALGEQ